MLIWLILALVAGLCVWRKWWGGAVFAVLAMGCLMWLSLLQILVTMIALGRSGF